VKILFATRKPPLVHEAGQILRDVSEEAELMAMYCR
jgi:hypothetical protein